MEILINLFFCCSTCRNHHPVPYLFMTCDRIFNNIGTTTIEAIKVHLWFLVGFSVLNREFLVGFGVLNREFLVGFSVLNREFLVGFSVLNLEFLVGFSVLNLEFSV